MQRQATATKAGAGAPEDGGTEDLLPAWGRVAGFLGVMASVFVMALVIGRLTGPEAPGAAGQSTPDVRPADTGATSAPDTRHGHGR
ncbi:MAG TPA: hypothetical protein VLH10_23095 [Yinghuangia sp.]|nr:hypothetical protein [Yinghuangia sp.]